MKFVAVIDYLQDKEKISALRPRHREYLALLRDRGQLAASGPFMDDSGALIIYEAAEVGEAEGLLKGDPFYENGIFVHYRLRAWRPVVSNPDLLSQPS
jgi:uncharacterized protein YciI